MKPPRYRVYQAGDFIEVRMRRDALQAAARLNREPGAGSWDGSANVWDTLTERWIGHSP